MRRRAGFTLLEIMVVIVITGVVALIVYGTAAAGFDTDRQLERVRTALETRAIVRDLLVDALRHPVPGGGAAMNDVLFAIDDAVSAEGVPVDAVHFFSRGVTPPLGASVTWSITLSPAGDGIRLLAVSGDPGWAAPIDALLADVRGLNVRVLSRTADSLWSDGWDAPGRVPAAVRLEFFSASGAPAAPPLVVHSALETVR